MKIKFGTRRILEAAREDERQRRREFLKNEENETESSERRREIKSLLMNKSINKDFANFN